MRARQVERQQLRWAVTVVLVVTILALGVGGVSAQEAAGDTATTQSASVVGEFNGTVSEGVILINGSSPTDFGGAQASINVSELDGSIQIDGEVYDNKTWQSTNVDFPNLKAQNLIDFSSIDAPVDIGPDNIDEQNIQVNVDPISGTYDPDAGANGLVTGDLNLTIDAFVSISVLGIGDSVDFTLAVNGASSLTLTTGQSGSVSGSAQNLESTGTTATVVNNDHVVPKGSGDTTVAVDNFLVTFNRDLNNELNLPSDDPTRNFIELTLDLDWVNGPPDFGPSLPALPGRDNPPEDSDGDGLHEDVRGDGSVTIMDVQTLFMNLDTPAVQDNSEVFNFQGATPGEVGILDVQALYDKHVNN
jgi:hypothetical protein